MDINLEWGKLLPLKHASDGMYHVDLEEIPRTPGIYIFYRAFGDSARALYVGKAGDLRSRIKQQLNAHRLMTGVGNAAIGSRFIAYGELKRRPGQQVGKCLELMERAMIRYYLAEKHELLNKNGTRIRKHSLASLRTTNMLRGLIPKDIDFE
jgi:hypothetical protein